MQEAFQINLEFFTDAWLEMVQRMALPSFAYQMLKFKNSVWDENN